jgi:hypothetical protein
LNVPPSSRALVRRVRSLSAAILTPASPRPSSRPTSAPDHSRKSRRRRGHAWQNQTPFALAGARLHLALPKLAPRAITRARHSPRRHSSIACLLRLRGIHRTRCLLGPFDACQPTLTWPPRTTLRLHADRPGLPPRLVPCRGSASHISCWIVRGHPPFRGFSPPVAARPSRVSPSPLPFLTSRCRGFEDFSVARHLRLAASLTRVELPSPCGADCPPGRTRSLCRRCSRHHRAAPLLVVSPLRG